MPPLWKVNISYTRTRLTIVRNWLSQPIVRYSGVPRGSRPSKNHSRMRPFLTDLRIRSLQPLSRHKLPQMLFDRLCTRLLTKGTTSYHPGAKWLNSVMNSWMRACIEIPWRALCYRAPLLPTTASNCPQANGHRPVSHRDTPCWVWKSVSIGVQSGEGHQNGITRCSVCVCVELLCGRKCFYVFELEREKEEGAGDQRGTYSTRKQLQSQMFEITPSEREVCPDKEYHKRGVPCDKKMRYGQILKRQSRWNYLCDCLRLAHNNQLII